MSSKKDTSSFFNSEEHKLFLEDIKERKAELDESMDAWWDSLTPEDKEKAFYSVVKRIYEGEVIEGGTYRYVLYDKFGFDYSMYMVGMQVGYLTLHNYIAKGLRGDDDVQERDTGNS